MERRRFHVGCRAVLERGPRNRGSGSLKRAAVAGARLVSALASFLWTLTLLSIMCWSETAARGPTPPLPWPAASGAEQHEPGATFGSDRHSVPAVVEQRTSLTKGIPNGEGSASAAPPRAPVPPVSDRRPATVSARSRTGLALARASARAPPAAA